MVCLISILIITLLLFVYWRYFYFFRDPKRTAPKGNNLVAPADGTVVYIKKVKKGTVPLSIKGSKEIKLQEIVKTKDVLDDQYLIGIFMSPFSVHVNRAPIAGLVKKISYFKAKTNLPMTKMFWRTFLKIKPYFKGSVHIFENERNTILIEGDLSVWVVQIADQYVNKIVCRVREGQILKKGQRIGLIKMGSQVDLVFPAQKGLKIEVKEGQYVWAGQTIMASY